MAWVKEPMQVVLESNEIESRGEFAPPLTPITKGVIIKPRKKRAELKKLEERTHEIHDMFRPKLEELELDTADEIAISTALYDLTGELRRVILEAREKITI